MHQQQSPSHAFIVAFTRWVVNFSHSRMLNGMEHMTNLVLSLTHAYKTTSIKHEHKMTENIVHNPN